MRTMLRVSFPRVVRLLMLAAALSVSGCAGAEHAASSRGPLMPREPEMLARITANTGVQVALVEGVPPALAQALAEAVSKALQEQDIPALAPPGIIPGAHALRGKAALAPDALSVAWILTAPDGKPVAKFTGRDAAGPTAAADDPALMALAARAALAIAPHFSTAGGDTWDATRVFVRDVSGAPGDGNAVLPQALRRALSGAGVSVSQIDDSKAVQVEGRVLLSELNTSAQLLKLSWRVLDPAGAEIGVIDQQNQVATGQIDTNWGEIAYLAADGAKDGIIDLLDAYRSKAQPAQAPPP